MTRRNVSQLVFALHMYATDNNDLLPPSLRTNQDLRVALDDYIKNDQAFLTLNPNGGSIVPNPHLAGVTVYSITLVDKTEMVYETAPWPDGKTTFGFVDTHVTRVTDTSLVIMEPVLKPQD